MRSTFSFVAVVLAGTSVLAGCGTELERTQATRPVGSDFEQALYSDYVRLSASELAEGDLRDADAFAERARDAGGPRTVQPEELWSRDIPPQHDVELGLARVLLVNALNASARNKAPADASRAQTMFDCWMQEQEENFQSDDIAACRDGFYESLKVIQGAVAIEVKVSETAPEAPAFEPRSYVVYFGLDSTDLTGSALSVVDQAARYARRFPGAEVVIKVVGHTDTTGSKTYNLQLGAGRAKAVVQALESAGIGDTKVTWVSKGEEEPAVATADGEQTPLNRRATLDVTQ
jgi:OOP family OmpA-OmpF porin